MDFIDFPNEFKQMLGYPGIVTTLYMTDSFPTTGDQDLTLGSKPKVHPQRQVNENDCI